MKVSNGFIGNKAAVSRLQSALSAGRVHAVLLVGPRSVGKSTLAVKIAEQRLGRPLKTVEPEVTRIESTDGKRIGIKEVQALLQTTRQSAVGLRTIIISDADRLTPEAGNALLVFLENTPPNTLCILTSPSAAAVLPTIKSRCTPFVFGPVATAELRQGLIDSGHLEPALLEEAVRLSAGLPGRAIRFMEEPQARVAIRTVEQQAAQWQTSDLVARMRMAATIADDPMRARALLERLGSAEASVHSGGDSSSVAIKPHVLVALRRLDRNVTPRAVLEAFAMLSP